MRQATQSHLIQRRLSGIIMILFGLLLFSFIPCRGQNPPSKDYQLKAEYLLNFCQYVEWPSNEIKNGDSLFIGVLGPNPFGTYLEEKVTGETEDGHPVAIRYLNDIKQQNKCHIIFINNTLEIKPVLEYLSGKSVLTVSDANDFAKSGGMIQFYEENDRTRIRVNLEVAKTAGLTISSKLLRVADIIQ